MLEPTEKTTASPEDLEAIAAETIMQILGEYFTDCRAMADGIVGTSVMDAAIKYELLSRPSRAQVMLFHCKVHNVVELLRCISVVNNEGRLFAGQLQQWEKEHSVTH